MQNAIRLTMTCCLFVMIPMLLDAQSFSLLKDIRPGNDTTRAAVSRDVADGIMYFQTKDYTGNPTIWRTDGTTAGTRQFTDAAAMGMIRAIDGVVYFQGAWDPTNGIEPWRSDGTSAGTFMLADINRRDGNSHPRDFISFAGDVYFRVFYFKRKNGSPYLEDYNWELWKTDGTTAGTGKVGSMPFHMDLTPVDNSLILDGIDLYVSDGSGVTELMDVCPTFPADWYSSCMSDPYAGWPRVYGIDAIRKPIVVNGIYYQTLFNAVSGGELWRSDGTPAGTWQCTDINPGPGSSYPSFLIPMGSYVYFAAYSPDNGTEIWRYPLTGTMLSQAERVCDIVPGSGSSEPMWLTVMDGKLYFSAYREAEGRELWMSDGVPNGLTDIVQDINPGPGSSDPQYTSVEYDGGGDGDRKFNRTFATIGGTMYFAATEPMHGYELWSSDGVTATLAADVNPGAGSSFARGLTVLNGKILFNAYEPSVGWEWWAYSTGANLPPIAMASAIPSSGATPLTVQFDGSASYDPEDGSNITYAWDFGDGMGSSTQMNPTYTYTSAATYTATLTVTDQDNATDSDQVTIIVTATPSGYIYVSDQSVTRISLPGNKIAAEDVVLIRDENGDPVSGALVYADFTGPTSGSVSGTTDANGEVTLVSDWDRKPSGDWCFTVIDVQAAGKTYNSSANVVTTACEGTPKKNHLHPAFCVLHQNAPNPFKSNTTISYTLTRPTTVSLVVTDALGREVWRAAPTVCASGGEADAGTGGGLAGGTHSVEFDARGLPAGMYFYRLETPETLQMQRMLLVR